MRSQVSKAARKKLVYVLNYVQASDVQHFVHVLNLLQALRERGWSIVLLSEKGGRGTRDVGGQAVTYLSESGRWGRIPRLVLLLLRLRLRGYRLVFVRISKPPALIASVLGKLIGQKTLYWQSGTVHDFDRAKPWRSRWRDALQTRLLVRAVDRFVTGPETMLDYYRKALSVPAGKLMLLYNDIDLSRFRPSARQPGPGPLNVLLVHRFSPVRRTDYYFPSLIRRLSKLAASRPVRFTLIGEGPELPELRAQAEAAGPGLEVEFLGPVPNRELERHYAAADVFVMPSYREGFPRVIIEAMAMGLPIVSTDAGGTRDLVGPLQSRYTVERDDPEGLADRLAELLGDPDMRRALGEENLERVRRYSTENVALMYDEALKALL